jgi:hypothetical protein
MFSKKTKASVGVETARGLIEDPEIRQAAAQVATGSSRLGFSVTKRMARRKTRRRLKRYRDVAQAVGPVLAQYGPQAAQTLGLVEQPEPPKPRRKPAVAAGVLIGAGTVYFLEPGAGRGHREQLVRAVAAIRS